MKKNVIRLLSFIPAIVIAVVIFGFSGQDGEESAGISAMLAGWFYDVLLRFDIVLAESRAQAVELMQYPIRKLAHMSEYAVFTAALHLPALAYGLRQKWRYVLPFAAAVCYAALDEFHQRFVPGRAGCVTDVLIDSVGVILMTIFLWVLFPKKKKCDNITI